MTSPLLKIRLQTPRRFSESGRQVLKPMRLQCFGGAPQCVQLMGKRDGRHLAFLPAEASPHAAFDPACLESRPDRAAVAPPVLMEDGSPACLPCLIMYRMPAQTWRSMIPEYNLLMLILFTGFVFFQMVFTGNKGPRHFPDFTLQRIKNNDISPGKCPSQEPLVISSCCSRWCPGPAAGPHPPCMSLCPHRP